MLTLHNPFHSTDGVDLLLAELHQPKIANLDTHHLMNSPASTDESQRLRNINLVEVLHEDAQEKGISCSLPEDLFERTEGEIRGFFQTLQPSLPQMDFAKADDAEFRRWFPGLDLSRTTCSDPKWRVLCFANAGNAEDMYTSEGTGSRRSPSPLLEWCRANQAECLAVQLPGRNMRKHEPPLQSCHEVAAALLPVVASRLQDVPYMVIAHSVGCWNAFEFLQLAREKGLQMPKKAFFSAMAAPSIAEGQRPWRAQHLLSDAEFKDECRRWDVNELIFSEAMWATYMPLMRADFRLFDEYTFKHQGKEPFHFPIVAFWGSRDRQISEDMVTHWQEFTTEDMPLLMIEGNHLWPLAGATKSVWLHQVLNRFP